MTCYPSLPLSGAGRRSGKAATHNNKAAKKRTLMIEIWTKLAFKYSKSLDLPNLKEVVEPIQTAVGARGGPERVLQEIRRPWNSILLMSRCTLTPTRA